MLTVYDLFYGVQILIYIYVCKYVRIYICTSMFVTLYFIGVCIHIPCRLIQVVLLYCDFYLSKDASIR